MGKTSRAGSLTAVAGSVWGEDLLRRAADTLRTAETGRIGIWPVGATPADIATVRADVEAVVAAADQAGATSPAANGSARSDQSDDIDDLGVVVLTRPADPEHIRRVVRDARAGSRTLLVIVAEALGDETIFRDDVTIHLDATRGFRSTELTLAAWSLTVQRILLERKDETGRELAAERAAEFERKRVSRTPTATARGLASAIRGKPWLGLLGAIMGVALVSLGLKIWIGDRGSPSSIKGNGSPGAPAAPTPSTEPPIAGTLATHGNPVATETFDRPAEGRLGESGGFAWNSTTGDWNSGGGLLLGVRSTDDPVAIAIATAGDAQPTPGYFVEATFGGSTDTLDAVGIVFRAKDDKNFWVVQLHRDFATWSVDRFEDGEPLSVASLNPLGVDPGLKVGVESTPNKVIITFNGQPLREITSDYLATETGVGVLNAGTAAVSIDSLTLAPVK